MSEPPVIAAQAFDLVCFDLDGVITRTARLHALAWKELFDGYLRKRQGETFVPFDCITDYRLYVDGRPRYEGVQSFLGSRGIILDYGDAADLPMAETICGLGNAKNQYFLEILSRQGVEVYQPAIDLVHKLKAVGIAVAVVSASKNCEAILRAADVAHLFDTRIDGVIAEAYRLKGKPASDTFLEASRRVSVDPKRTVVIEDALSGVEAGRAGGFGLVIGVDRAGQRRALRAHGADVVVEQLSEISVVGLPSALDALPEIAARLRTPDRSVLLDYDGTLAPIALRPEDAKLTDDMRATIAALAQCCTVGVVTGREMEVIKGLVRLDNLIYAADHGFEIARPGVQPMVYAEAYAFLPAIDQAEVVLRDRLADIEGALIERKHFSVAVHYRLVPAERIADVGTAVDEVLGQLNRLRKMDGKEVVELLPRLDWNKGTAIRWILETLGIAPASLVYMGDDITDEDAFRAIRDEGMGVVVRDKMRPTMASYCLDNQSQVEPFLQSLIDHLSRQPS